jgi:NADPH:quinone reductase-like Zn-dependent oxidoreductase
VREIEVPAPGPHQILIRVIRAGINFKDLKTPRMKPQCLGAQTLGAGRSRYCLLTRHGRVLSQS